MWIGDLFLDKKESDNKIGTRRKKGENMSCNSNKSKRYTNTFKQQIVELIKNGKSTRDVHLEYNIARSTISKWYKDFTSSGSFQAKDNEDPKDHELKHLRKELTYAKMEVDILKQAALIMGRK